MALAPTSLQGKTAFYGGTFNPIHNGHLAMAKEAIQQLGLKEVVFIPTGDPPHKKNNPDKASPADRFEMVRLATVHDPQLTVSDIETSRPGPHYTTDTIDLLEAQGKITSQLGSKTPFILGSDSLYDLPNWQNPLGLIQKLFFIQIKRPGTPVVNTLPINGQTVPIDTVVLNLPENPISSTQVRETIKQGLPFQHLVPKPVADFITQKKLWQTP
jgi:nicotinate-nucleotide adenylyltransferase